jgi:protein-L-isoaspartate(D-aspartate) O-methyltransferase
LAEGAAGRLRIAGVTDAVTSTVGDGLAPDLPSGSFERILLNGASLAVPPAVTSLLALGGRLVGAITLDGFPRLVRIDRQADGSLRQELGGALRISPLVPGAASSL